MIEMKKVDLNLLLVFEALLQVKNVTQAGALVGISQPATSFALSKLRQLLNDPLFVRTPQGMQPTPQALVLAKPIQQALGLIRNDVLQRTELDLLTTTRRFTIAMTDVAEMVFLPRLLRLLKEEAPLANLKTVIMSSAELEIALEAGSVDLAIGLFPDLKRASFYQQRIFQHPFVCIVRSDHPTIGRRMSMQQFLDASHAVIEAEGRNHEIFEQVLQRRGLKRRVLLSVPHFLSIPMVIADSDLVVTVPYVLGEVFSRSTKIRLVPPPVKVANYDVRQYWHERYHKDPANRWLRTAIAERFKKGPDL
jgi:DNA-binding transcriptional LysR family regulator